MSLWFAESLVLLIVTIIIITIVIIVITIVIIVITKVFAVEIFLNRRKVGTAIFDYKNLSAVFLAWIKVQVTH
jgi:hypothetical protein